MRFEDLKIEYFDGFAPEEVRWVQKLVRIHERLAQGSELFQVSP